MNRAEVVASGGRYLAPSVDRLKVAGHFVAFVLASTPPSPGGISDERDFNLVVFDLARERRELTENDGCTGGPTEECDLAGGQFPLRYAIASNGWVAEAWTLSASYAMQNFDVAGDVTLVATDDGKSHYAIDFGARLSSLSLSGRVLSWTSDLGGASSVTLGPDVIPSAAPQAMTACQLLTAADVEPVLGSSSSSSAPGQCSYTSTASQAMTLEVGLETGQSASEQTAYEQALQDDGWDNSMSLDGGFQGYQMATATAGESHQRLYAFENGAELSLDLAAPGTSAPEQLAWLTDVAFDRLFGVPVERAQ